MRSDPASRTLHTVTRLEAQLLRSVLTFILVSSTFIAAQIPIEKSEGGDQEARAIICQVIAAQQGTDGALALSSFTGRFCFRVFEYEKDGKLKASRPGTIEQSWARVATGKTTKTAYRRTLTTDNSRAVTLLLDFENHAWKIPQDEDVPPILLRRKEHKKDRENLKSEARRIDRLLDSFVLASADDLKDLRLLAQGEPVEFVISRETFKFPKTDRVGFTDDDGSKVEWWVDRTTHRVVKSRLTSSDDKAKKVVGVFHMGYHIPVQVADGKRRLEVPHWITYLENDRPMLEIITSRKGAIRINTLGAIERKKLFQARID